MPVELARMRNGTLALLSDAPFPAPVRHIEYYREQRLLQLVFEGADAGDMLIARELDPQADAILTRSPELMVVVMAEQGKTPCGYDVSLVQIGV